MIPYEVDPSLHNDKPAEQALDDGFSPPASSQQQPPVASPTRDSPPEPVSNPLGDKSGF
jgi:hypothetical protein